MTKQESLKKIGDLVAKSAISDADKHELMKVLGGVDDADMLEALVEVFQEEPSWIKKVIDNYMAKRAAYLTGDGNLMERIIKGEADELEELEDSLDE